MHWAGVPASVFDAAGRQQTVTDPLQSRQHDRLRFGGRGHRHRRCPGPNHQFRLRRLGPADRDRRSVKPNRTTTYSIRSGATPPPWTRSCIRTTAIYDAFGRNSATQDAAGNLSTTVYDTAGRVAAQVDALGRRISFSYDALDRQVAVTDPLNISRPRFMTPRAKSSLPSMPAEIGLASLMTSPAARRP